MGILGFSDPEPAQNLRPKMARINMIGASGGSETPTPTPQGVTSASEGIPVEQQHWRCEFFKGNWYETNEMGADWMINKVQFLMRKTGALSHECDACTGVTWDGGHEKRGTETGLYWAGNTPWVFKGFATEWVSARKVYSGPIDRPLWTPPPLNLPDFDPKMGIRVIIMDMDSPSASAENTPISSPRPYTEPSSPTSSDSASAESHSSYRQIFDPPHKLCLLTESNAE